MLKNIISPVQAWLISQGRCGGCGRDLPKIQKKGMVRVDCVCRRVYMYDSEANTYRRANLDEIS